MGSNFLRRLEYRCNCGAECRVEIEGFLGASAGGFGFKHCKEDVPHLTPGPIIAAWIENDGRGRLGVRK